MRGFTRAAFHKPGYSVLELRPELQFTLMYMEPDHNGCTQVKLRAAEQLIVLKIYIG
jgi:hypothetical protein